MLARHLSVQECDVVHLEHAVVSVDEVGLVLAVDEHHVPGAVSLPGNLYEYFAVEKRQKQSFKTIRKWGAQSIAAWVGFYCTGWPWLFS